MKSVAEGDGEEESSKGSVERKGKLGKEGNLVSVPTI